MGDKDHVGASLQALGVEIFFNRVNVKPGKPTTFGRRGRTLVFGLPGNPVAALVCFHLFVMTAIRKRLGFSDPRPRRMQLSLRGEVGPSGDRPTFRPARLVTREGGLTSVEALRWYGSGDLAACVGADGFLFQPPGGSLLDGQPVDFYPLNA